MKSTSQVAGRDQGRVEVEPDATARPFAEMAGVLRRGWWIALLVVVVAGVVPYARFTREPVTYHSSQTLYIVVTPVGASSNYDNYQAAAWAETIGHALAEGRLTSVSGSFAGAINTLLAGMAESGGDPRALSSSQFQQNLSWSNEGNHVVLTASWTSPEGARELLAATVTALGEGNLTHVTVWRGALPDNLVAHVMAAGAPTSAQPDHQLQQERFVEEVLARLALSVPAGILLLFALEWLRRSRAGAIK
jgi:hypothetical protein